MCFHRLALIQPGAAAVPRPATPPAPPRSEIPRLQALARQTGRHVGPHIAMLLASLEGAALVPNELQAQVGAARRGVPRRGCLKWR